jgi:pyrimidine operon attenuation protein/uracil phosphoribosyltransferase
MTSSTMPEASSGHTDPARTVLTEADVARALTRIAHEIVERNKGASDVVLLGIPSRGVPLAERLSRKLREIEPQVAGRETGSITGELDVTMYRDDLSRQPTRSIRRTRLPDGGIGGRVVVLVDDVLYSGRTIRAALDALADLGRPRVVQLAVLVDRGHRELPIRPDYVGKNLPTSHSERVRVHVSEYDGEDLVTIEAPTEGAAR